MHLANIQTISIIRNEVFAIKNVQWPSLIFAIAHKRRISRGSHLGFMQENEKVVK